jgi:hypothetical protein
MPGVAAVMVAPRFVEGVTGIHNSESNVLKVTGCKSTYFKQFTPYLTHQRSRFVPMKFFFFKFWIARRLKIAASLASSIP